MDRRTFLKTSAAGGALIAVGCGNPVNAAPLTNVVADNNATTFTTAVLNTQTGLLQFNPAVYSDLVPVGGAITLKLPSGLPSDAPFSVPPDGTILVVHETDTGYLAVQSSCPHAGCPLGYAKGPKMIECPCHSSRFYGNSAGAQCVGAVEHAPARGALARWPAKLVMGVLAIDLSSALSCDCPTPPMPAISGNTLTLPLADFPTLAMPGGAACGRPPGATDPIVVVRIDANTVAAIDAKCTHRGCTVSYNAQNKDLECPCHGSAFATDGRVLSAPATTPLKTYAATITATAIVVTIV
jgi:cytochrome b6-f complex iron-sulfur subunit